MKPSTRILYIAAWILCAWALCGCQKRNAQVLMGTPPVLHQNPKSRIRVLVTGTKNHATTKLDAEVLESVRFALLETVKSNRRYLPLDRDHRTIILEEQAISQSGMYDPTKLIQVGKLLSAQWILIPAILEVNVQEKKNVVLLFKEKSVEIEVVLGCQVLDAKTGEVVFAHSASASQSYKEKNVDLNFLQIEAKEIDTKIIQIGKKDRQALVKKLSREATRTLQVYLHKFLERTQGQ